MEQMQDICRGSVGPLERTQGSEFMMMPMIIFGRYYSIYVILHLATANYCQ
jgi:hypothetical protein